MPRFRRMAAIRPVNRIKHVVDTEGGLTNTAAIIPLATAVVVRSAVFNPAEVVIGETVNGIFITFFIIGSTGAPVNGSQSWYIAKSRSGQSSSTDFPNPHLVGQSDVRNQVFHQEKGLVGSGDGTAMAFKGVIAIPKGMRRMREGDEIFLKAINNGTDSAEFCVQAHYNSYS